MRELKWTPAWRARWQEFYDKASRIAIFGVDEHGYDFLPKLPAYDDLERAVCNTSSSQVPSTNAMPTECNSATRQNTLIFLAVIPFVMKKLFAS